MLSDRIEGEFTTEDEAVLVQLAQIASVCIRNALDAKAHLDAEERLAATQEHANIAIGECDREGQYVRVNSGFTALTGYAQDEILARTFFDFTDPADLDAERERHQRQLEGHARAYTSEKRFQHKDGSTRWALLSASAVFDAAGRFLYAIRILQDITPRKRAEEHLAVQARELHHRVRNTLATVQGIMGATARASGDIESFKRAFSGRLASIARAHTLLTTDDWQTAPLCALIEAEIDALEPHLKEQITTDGPPVDLPASIAVPLSMALHELADNALRYGALVTVDGQVAISWSIIETNESDVLALHWCERGGPSIPATVAMGYGRTLLTKVLPPQAKALVNLKFEDAGVSFQISAPLGRSRREP
jgi:PAS domain S-box-containing protein